MWLWGRVVPAAHPTRRGQESGLASVHLVLPGSQSRCCLSSLGVGGGDVAPDTVR